VLYALREKAFLRARSLVFRTPGLSSLVMGYRGRQMDGRYRRLVRHYAEMPWPGVSALALPDDRRSASRGYGQSVTGFAFFLLALTTCRTRLGSSKRCRGSASWSCLHSGMAGMDRPRFIGGCL